MMASNALSPRRGFKPRPDVCKSLPNPGRCHPPDIPPEPPAIECSAEPAHSEIEEGDNVNIDLWALNSGLPVGDPIDVVLWVENGQWQMNTEPTNGTNGDAELQDQEEGVWDWSVLYTFSDSLTCLSVGTITVTGPP